MSSPLKQNWEFTVEYFKDLAGNDKVYSELQNLVNKLALSEYAEFIHPSVSVGNLSLSFNANYEFSNSYPTIFIKRSSEAELVIAYAKNAEKNTEFVKRKCNYIDAWNYLESLLLRMEIETKEKLKTE
jgi:hypothetical protein